MTNALPCNDCSRCIWDPTSRGFDLCCYGNDFVIKVGIRKRASFVVPECELAKPRPGMSFVRQEQATLTSGRYSNTGGCA